MTVLMQTQIDGAAWLYKRPTALLADMPRVGKTLTALEALRLQYATPGPVLIVTTASGRAVWRRAVKEWLGVEVEIVGIDKTPRLIRIVSWDALRQPKVFAYLSTGHFDIALLDESHRAGNPDTKTTEAIYGKFNRWGDRVAKGLVSDIPRVWCLSGTPIPHDFGQLWPMLRALAPHFLAANDEKGWPNVTSFEAFRARYCVMRPKKLSAWRTIMVVMGGKNEAELRERIGGWILRRTQKDVGIRPPVQELMPLIVSPAQRREIATDRQASEIVAAIDAGNTRELEMELGPLRRITGRIKAQAIVVAVKEWLEDNPGEKLVLAYYHREVGDILEEGLLGDDFVLPRIDGSTSAKDREWSENHFRKDPSARVFLAQIDAAGEAIDLSAAAELIFVETTFSPKAMKQMAARISNVSQTKNTFVRVAYIDGSIDDAIQSSLLRLWQSIREVVA